MASEGVILRNLSALGTEHQTLPDARPRRTHWIWQIVYIVYSFEVGLFLLVLPWMYFWDNNVIVFAYPYIRPIVSNAFLKGAVLGLGIVNIVIGFDEIATLRKRSAAQGSG